MTTNEQVAKLLAWYALAENMPGDIKHLAQGWVLTQLRYLLGADGRMCVNEERTLACLATQESSR